MEKNWNEHQFKSYIIWNLNKLGIIAKDVSASNCRSNLALESCYFLDLDRHHSGHKADLYVEGYNVPLEVNSPVGLYNRAKCGRACLLSFLFYEVYGNCLSYADKHYLPSPEKNNDSKSLKAWLGLPSFVLLKGGNTQKLFLKDYVDSLIDEPSQNIYLDLVGLSKIEFSNPLDKSTQYYHYKDEGPGFILTQVSYYLDGDREKA